MRNALASVLVVLAVLAAGCAGTGQKRTGEAATGAETEITDLVGQFIDFTMNEDYNGIKSLVAPAEAKDFDTRAFLEDRTRMKSGTYQILAWDKKFVAVTPVKGTQYELSSAVANVRILATNAVKPLYVNLYWQKQGGRWYIAPYPQLPKAEGK